MSKLDDILVQYMDNFRIGYTNSYEWATVDKSVKDGVKALMLELIDEVNKYPGQYGIEYRNGRHSALGQLRQKVEEL